MAGSHLAPSSAPKTKSKSAPQPLPVSQPRSGSKSSGGSGKWKIVVLVVILLVVIAALGFLLWQLFGDEIGAKLGLGGNDTPTVAEGITTQINAEYGNGRNMGGSISVTQGTQRPEEIPEAADVVLLDINWTSKKEMTEPLYITVSDPSFPDGDGLAVYHCESDGQWNLIGTYVIRDHAVTFLTESLSPFAFQVISSEPEPVATPEVSPTPEPTATPEPTPEPTPAPIQAVDYGSHTTIQTGVFSMVNEMQDDASYVVALVSDLPAGAVTVPVEEEEDDADDVGLAITYVDAPTTEQPVQDEAPAVTAAPKASVLVNLDGTNLGLIDMTLVQAEDGSWCLSGPVTDGMVWKSNRDGYKDEKRFSLGNNDRYLNLDDDDQNVILNDNHVRTRWLIENATLANGSQIATLSYRNDDRFYVSQMAKVAETLPGGAAAVTATQAPDGTTPETASTGPIYLGVAAPADTSAIRETLRFAVTTDQGQALQLVLFQVQEGLTAPEGVVSTLEHAINIPEIDEETNLSTLLVRDGDKTLQLGVDYTINARVFNESVVVIFQFIGNYTGQIVRTYEGTTILTNDMRLTTPTPAPSSSPIPSPSPTPYTGGEGSNAPSGGNTGNTGGTTPQQPTTPEQPTTPTDTPQQPSQPASGTDTQPDPVGDPSDTDA